ncbi:MAG: hypothetical protein ACO1QB_17315 [Verrucomicrobiales bacterium]
MGASIIAFIQIDDNTPEGEPPFSGGHPSTWDLSHDIGLYGGKHYDLYAAISGVRNRFGREPLFPMRGLPPRCCDWPKALSELAGDFNVSWLTLAEIRAALAHMGVAEESLGKPVLLVLQTMEDAEQLFGKDRVRLVFQVTD